MRSTLGRLKQLANAHQVSRGGVQHSPVDGVSGQKLILFGSNVDFDNGFSGSILQTNI